jgi:glutaredoxin 2
MSSTKLKSAQVRLNKVHEYISTTEADIKTLQQSLQKLKSQKGNIEAEIKRFTLANKELVVSEHALIRYMERVMDFDMTLIQGAMLEDQVKTAYKTFGNGTYPLTDGNKVVIKDNVIVSILN